MVTLQRCLRHPDEHLMEPVPLPITLACGLFVDRVRSLTHTEITLSTRERIGHATTFDEYADRATSLTEGYAEGTPEGGPGDRWFYTEGTVVYDGTRVARDLILIERHPFGAPVESVEDLAAELSALSETPIRTDEIREPTFDGGCSCCGSDGEVLTFDR
ncbi:hypothetical protein [Natronorarus salvus]|uniref:hypothetical protein n=1 Tax=Natronorarus salvus TaxID=3117733 RepID=UPI002F2654BA